MNTNHPGFMLMPFADYLRYIPTNTSSIGIVTQPFEHNTTQHRPMDGMHNGAKCRILVTALLEDVRRMFPRARIRLHNDAHETIALTYARMIMARTLIVGISSFGVFPALANFGDAYVRRPDYNGAPNKWLLRSPVAPKPEGFQTTFFSSSQKLFPRQIRKSWAQDETGAQLVAWFRNESSLSTTLDKK